MATRFSSTLYGRDLYDDMLAAIDAATGSIYLETYLWKADEAGEEFKRRLARKAEQGVAVYAVFDAVGNLVVPREFKQFPPSIHTLKHHAISWPRHLLDPRRTRSRPQAAASMGRSRSSGGITSARYSKRSGATHTCASPVRPPPISLRHLWTSGTDTAPPRIYSAAPQAAH